MKCKMPQYGDRRKQCGEDAVLGEELEIDAGEFKLTIPVCQHHADTWMILIGHKELARLIGQGFFK